MSGPHLSLLGGREEHAYEFKKICLKKIALVIIEDLRINVVSSRKNKRTENLRRGGPEESWKETVSDTVDV